MIAEISKGTASGKFIAPPSKSMAHRLLICAGLAQNNCLVDNISLSDDISATINCLKAMGINCEFSGKSVKISGINQNFGEIFANCKESGSTLRFFIPIFWALGKKATLFGSNYLFTRPLSVYENIAENNNLLFNKYADKIVIDGKLQGGEYNISGNISSQFISGMLFALPLCENDSVINIIPPLESKPYIDMTVSALETFGIKIKWLDDFKLFINGNQKYKINDVTVEGDYSNAAFFAALNSLGSKIEISGLNKKSLQGDKVIFDCLNELEKGDAVINVENCPDIAPILITAAAYLNGGKFTGTARLKLKESDRGNAIAEELAKFGADITLSDNEIIVNKSVLHKPDEILSGHNDHRIVMSLAVLLTKFSGKIENCEAVNKSFPNFFDVLKSLGIGVKIYE